MDIKLPIMVPSIYGIYIYLFEKNSPVQAPSADLFSRVDCNTFLKSCPARSGIVRKGAAA